MSYNAMTMSENSLREIQKERRKAEIYEAAIYLFRAQGFVNTTTNEIARMSGVSRGTFFNYYPYKEAVLLEFGAKFLAQVQQQAAEMMQTSKDPVGVLYHIFDEISDMSEKEQALFLPLAYEVINPERERAIRAYQMLPLAQLVAYILTPLATKELLNDRLSLMRISNIIADTFVLTALRSSAYGSNRTLKEEVRLALNLLLEGGIERGGIDGIER